MSKTLVFVGLLTATVGPFAHGWFLYMYWGWFISPVVGFSLGYWHSIGLSIMVAVLRTIFTPAPEYSDEKALYKTNLIRSFAVVFVTIPLAVFVGWLISQVM